MSEQQLAQTPFKPLLPLPVGLYSSNLRQCNFDADANPVFSVKGVVDKWKRRARDLKKETYSFYFSRTRS